MKKSVEEFRSRLRAIAWATIKRWIRYQFPTIPSISTHTLAVWLQQEDTEKPLLLDARTQREFEVSHLPQAHFASTPLPDLRQWHEVTLSAPIVTYCSVGYRSAILAQQLQKMGYEKVFNLEGSMFEWVNQGWLVYQGDQVVQQVHSYNQFWGLLLDPASPTLNGRNGFFQSRESGIQ
jgi:rhodanese-related sulfurtransferase